MTYNIPPMATIFGHSDLVRSIAFSPDENTLATANYDSTICLWDTTTGEHKMTFTGNTLDVQSVAFSPDGTILASGNYDGNIRLWDTMTGKWIRTLTGTY